MTRVVVTGGSGYIGRSVVALLEQSKHEVVALTRGEAVGQFQCLLSGEVGPLGQHFEGAEHVIHLAARLVHDANAGVLDYFQANVALTDSVLSAAADAGVRSVVHASSRLVYPATLTSAADEIKDVAPDTPYGLSKRWAEDLTKHYASSSNVSGISLRIGQVTGGDHPGLGVINSFIRQARENGRIVIHGKGSAIRDIVHVQDVARALVSAIAYEGEYVALNIGGTRSVTIREIASIVAKAAAEHVELIEQPVPQEDTSCYALETGRARKVLSWAPSWSPEEIIAAAFADWS